MRSSDQQKETRREIKGDIERKIEIKGETESARKHVRV